MRFDLITSCSGTEQPDSVPRRLPAYEARKKSALLAGTLSLVLPGAGEYYTQSYWRAGGFLLAEAGLWVFYGVYYSKGNKQTDLFQNYADAHWSVVRYAQWIQDNLSQLNPDVTSFTGYLIPNTGGLPPWQQVDWSKLNAVENAIAQRPGNGFTHLLPLRPQQQYYELIGKYPQFAAGWDDAGVMPVQHIVASNVSQRFLDYSQMRGKANDFYNIASTGAGLLVVNHLLSALDAAWDAARFNQRLSSKLTLTTVAPSTLSSLFRPGNALTF